MSPLRLIDDYITKILMEIGDQFSRGEIFLIDLTATVSVVEKAMEILKPAFEKSTEKLEYLGKIVIGNWQRN